MPEDKLVSLIQSSISAREWFISPKHASAYRLFNGFTEGFPELSIDVYAKTGVIHNYSKNPQTISALIQQVASTLIECLPWLSTIVIKARYAATQAEQNGTYLLGAKVNRQIEENRVLYQINPLLNQDSSFYLDTRNLRSWLKDNMSGKTVLNTFAYTGSLGIAALAGGAISVEQLDINKLYLQFAKDSYALNGFSGKVKYHIDDFWKAVKRLNREEQRFDCVILDPPFFTTNQSGTIDISKGSKALINKLRPLINDDGYLISVNNALFLSGADYVTQLEEIFSDGYLSLQEIIPVSSDCVGYNVRTPYKVSPEPFNHPTKIAIIRVRRKQ